MRNSTAHILQNKRIYRALSLQILVLSVSVNKKERLSISEFRTENNSKREKETLCVEKKF